VEAEKSRQGRQNFLFPGMEVSVAPDGAWNPIPGAPNDESLGYCLTPKGLSTLAPAAVAELTFVVVPFRRINYDT
jgi:hypothetical protein